MEAIQDYIGESDNLVELHKEVRGEVISYYIPSAFLAWSRRCESASRDTELQLLASPDLAKHIVMCGTDQRV
jgi:hypothetical protein